jgi:DNA repair photolyase
MNINKIKTNDYLSVSKLPESDYVINPYVGCPHACSYCYASFMLRFTNHQEKWGEFLDVKVCNNKINKEKIAFKNVFMSSVTDCYNPYEAKYKLTRGILESLVDVDFNLTIATKNSLVLRDIDILKKYKNVEVAISINTLDEKLKKDMDRASSIKDRINTLKVLHENGIRTILFMSPIFPGLTNYKEIINETREFVDCYWFENLNLRIPYKNVIMNYIKINYPKYYPLYYKIYEQKDLTYFRILESEINDFCKKENICFKNYFYHEKIRKS